MKRFRSRTFTTALLLIGAGVFLFQCFDYLNFTVDDVFITFRVAENVAHGDGFAYNVGDFVEGYSNWLWVTILSGAASIGFNQQTNLFSLLWFAKGVSFAFGCINLILIYFLSKKFFISESSHGFEIVPFLIAASSGAFAFWSMSGMETNLCTFFYLLASIQIVNLFQWKDEYRNVPLHSYFLLALALLGMVLTRPEPILHVTAIVFILLFSLSRHERSRFFLGTILPFAIGFGLFLLWRWMTYHDLLPNTFYAKTFGGWTRLLLAVKYTFSAFGFIAGPAILFFVLPIIQFKAQKKEVRFLVAMTALTIIFVLYSSGDAMPGYRFFIPVSGYIGIICAKGFEMSFNALTRLGYLPKISFAAASLIITLLIGVRTFEDRTHIRGTQPDMASGFKVQTGVSLPEHIVIAEWVATNAPGRVHIATGEAGIIGYRNLDMVLLDCNGLMDKNIARARKNLATIPINTILDQKPEYVILPGIVQKDIHLIDASAVVYYTGAFLASTRFKQEYKLCFQYFSFGVYKRV